MNPLAGYLVLSAFLFAIGLAGALTRRNAIIVLIGIELMLNAANLNFIAFWRYRPEHPGSAHRHHVRAFFHRRRRRRGRRRPRPHSSRSTGTTKPPTWDEIEFHEGMKRIAQSNTPGPGSAAFKSKPQALPQKLINGKHFAGGQFPEFAFEFHHRHRLDLLQVEGPGFQVRFGNNVLPGRTSKHRGVRHADQGKLVVVWPVGEQQARPDFGRESKSTTQTSPMTWTGHRLSPVCQVPETPGRRLEWPIRVPHAPRQVQTPGGRWPAVLHVFKFGSSFRISVALMVEQSRSNHALIKRRMKFPTGQTTDLRN